MLKYNHKHCCKKRHADGNHLNNEGAATLLASCISSKNTDVYQTMAQQSDIANEEEVLFFSSDFSYSD